MIPLIVGALASLGTTIAANASARKNAKRTNQANLELAKYQQNANVDLWREQNAYNSPEQQMARLKSAGLNPALVYGSSAVTGNTTSSAPQMDIPRADYNREIFPYNPLQVMSAYQDWKQRSAQTNNLEAQNAVIVQKAATEALKQSNVIANTSRTKQMTLQAQELHKYALDAAIQNIRNMTLQHSLMNAQMTKTGYETSNLMQDIRAKKYSNHMREEYGIRDSDALPWRVFSKFLNSLGFGFKNLEFLKEFVR